LIIVFKLGRPRPNSKGRRAIGRRRIVFKLVFNPCTRLVSGII